MKSMETILSDAGEKFSTQFVLARKCSRTYLTIGSELRCRKVDDLSAISQANAVPLSRITISFMIWSLSLSHATQGCDGNLNLISPIATSLALLFPIAGNAESQDGEEVGMSCHGNSGVRISSKGSIFFSISVVKCMHVTPRSK
ncbi:predicted protein [Sclerotinia sclerotiorum 1980 UF-70]|uniref:Uncharacterized protein n=1 Tax=Sclerotinia sclerotiorum (strain ATCC 18683 / 1980 / Ss-1) TaxID=665079 RepID=A7FA01_SCLS1|nr:predicted protein [Sclerotinia sclerotiorum 1980 UF-70]EDO00562.1 predicted protein [Sclerotinia sclerotiorum 1980 UF-70]